MCCSKGRSIHLLTVTTYLLLLDSSLYKVLMSRDKYNELETIFIAFIDRISNYKFTSNFCVLFLITVRYGVIDTM
jgi:hypothetical protein